MAKLEPWDGRRLCTLELADAYTDSETAVPIMGGAAVFQKGVADEAHPYARRKKLALTYQEAVSLSDGRFTVEPVAEEEASAGESESETSGEAVTGRKSRTSKKPETEE